MLQCPVWKPSIFKPPVTVASQLSYWKSYANVFKLLSIAFKKVGEFPLRCGLHVKGKDPF